MNNCPYNDRLNCPDAGSDKCGSCGWNPEVFRRRAEANSAAQAKKAKTEASCEPEIKRLRRQLNELKKTNLKLVKDNIKYRRALAELAGEDVEI